MLKNAIVVMFDSLQLNYLGCYGNEWIKTPNFDRFAREGITFDNCYAEGLPTIPVRRAMHTGRYTLPKGGWIPLSMEDTTIADLCWGRPIDTALIFDCPMYRQPKFGYTRGFDKVYFTHGHEMDNTYFTKDALYHYDPKDYISETAVKGALAQLSQATLNLQYGEIDSYLRQMQYWRSDEDRYVAKTMKQAVKYLEQVDRNKQFYLWVDSFDPHEPWNGPSVFTDQPCPYDPDYDGKDEFLPFMGSCEGMYTEKELAHIRMLYAECVSVCDKWFGYLLDAVRRLGFEENTLVFQVSDHGEPMGNGEHGHGIMRKCRPWPYEELAHVPAIIRFPGCEAGKRIKAFTSGTDVAPTICDWLGIGVHPSMQGVSLLPLCMGTEEHPRDFSIAGYYRASWAIYTEDWSYIHWVRNDKEALGSMDETSYKAIRDAIASVGAKPVGAPDDKHVKAKNKIAKLSDSDEWESQNAGATLDGEAKWTCTPGAVMQMGDTDELYDRHNDLSQLHNVLEQHPDIAAKLLTKLQDYLEDLRNS